MPAQTAIAGRRAELLAELFLQDLSPIFVARPQDDLGYDFLAGFDNGKGGTNVVAVEVKGTERDVKPRYPLPWKQLERLVHSNLPALLLVVNVKNSNVYWSWLPKADLGSHGASLAHVPVRLADSKSRGDLQKCLRA